MAKRGPSVAPTAEATADPTSLPELRQRFVDQIRSEQAKSDAFFDHWILTHPDQVGLAVAAKTVVDTGSDVRAAATAMMEPATARHTIVGDAARWIEDRQHQSDAALTQAEIEHWENPAMLGAIVAAKPVIGISTSFVAPWKLGEGVLSGRSDGGVHDGLALVAWLPSKMPLTGPEVEAAALAARENTLAATQQLAKEATALYPNGQWCSQLLTVGHLLTGSDRGYVSALQALEAVPRASLFDRMIGRPGAYDDLLAGKGLNALQTQAQADAMGLNTGMRTLKSDTLAGRMPELEAFVRNQPAHELTVFGINVKYEGQYGGHMMEAFVDKSGNFWLHDNGGIYTDLADFAAHNPQFSDITLREWTLSLSGTRYISPLPGLAARSLLASIGLPVDPVVAGDSDAVLEGMTGDFHQWQADGEPSLVTPADIIATGAVSSDISPQVLHGHITASQDGGSGEPSMPDAITTSGAATTTAPENLVTPDPATDPLPEAMTTMHGVLPEEQTWSSGLTVDGDQPADAEQSVMPDVPAQRDDATSDPTTGLLDDTNIPTDTAGSVDVPMAGDPMPSSDTTDATGSGPVAAEQVVTGQVRSSGADPDVVPNDAVEPPVGGGLENLAPPAEAAEPTQAPVSAQEGAAAEEVVSSRVLPADPGAGASEAVSAAANAADPVVPSTPADPETGPAPDPAPAGAAEAAEPTQAPVSAQEGAAAEEVVSSRVLPADPGAGASEAVSAAANAADPVVPSTPADPETGPAPDPAPAGAAEAAEPTQAPVSAQEGAAAEEVVSSRVLPADPGAAAGGGAEVEPAPAGAAESAEAGAPVSVPEGAGAEELVPGQVLPTDTGDVVSNSGAGMVDDQGNAFGSAAVGDAEAPITAGTIGWLAPGQQTSALFDAESGPSWESTSDGEEGARVTGNETSNESVSLDDGEANAEEIQVDPITSDPYAVDTVTGRATPIASTGVDSSGNPIYEAPTAAGGGSFEVGSDAGVSSVIASGPIDTSTWDAPVDVTSGLTDAPVTEEGAAATWYGGDESGGSTDGGHESGGSTDGGYESGGSTDGGYESGGSTDGGYEGGGSTDGGYDSGGTDGGYDSGGTDGGYDSGGTDGGYDSGGSVDGGDVSGSYDTSAPVEESAPAPVVEEPPPAPVVEDSG